MSRVLAICPHPDDEAFGCGGALHQHVVDGDVVHVVFLTSGEAGGHGRPPEETARLREEEAGKATRILGIAEVEFWRQPDGALRSTETLLRRLRQKLRQCRPQVIYVSHADDDHPDHRAAARLVRRAVGDARSSRTGIEIWMYEVWTPLRRIDRVVDISPHMEVKLAAVRAHQCQCAIMRFDDAVCGLNRYRGVMHSGWPAATYAEVFTAMRTGGR
jgi:LmbE family N-acetylglucosaminyl deacetylase